MPSIIKNLAISTISHTESSLTRIDYLDGWRGIAIALVLIEHFAGFHLPKVGRLGVDIFFVLSGMLMSRILFEKKTPLRIFYSRRFSRILPVFLLFVIASYAGSYFIKLDFSATEVLTTLAFLRTYIPTEPNLWATKVPIGHLWSINIEEHFYIILSLITLIRLPKYANALLLMIIGVITIYITVLYIRFSHMPSEGYALRTECASTCLFFSAGYCLLKDKLTPYINPSVPILTCCLSVVCYTHFVPWYFTFIVAPALLAFSVNHLSEAPQVFQQLLSLLPLRLLGVWSYSIYLWQQPFYSFKSVFPSGLAFATAMLLSVASFYLFENPTRTWLNRCISS